MRNSELGNYRFKVSWIKNYISKNIDDYFNYFKKSAKDKKVQKPMFQLWMEKLILN